MSRRIEESIAARIVALYFEYKLPASVIKLRLGVSERTIWNYIKAFRSGKLKDVSPGNRAEAA